jgi:hypothetical protein
MNGKTIDEMDEAELRAYARELERRLASMERIDFVYFMHDPEAQVVKIGHSKQVGQRLRALRQQTGRPLQVIGVTPGDKYLKRRMQLRFKAYMTDDAEWFEAAPELLAYVDAHCVPYQEEA